MDEAGALSDGGEAGGSGSSSGDEIDPHVAALLSAGSQLSSAAEDNGSSSAGEDVRDWSVDEVEDGAGDDGPRERDLEPEPEPEPDSDDQLELVVAEEAVAEEGVPERRPRSHPRSKSAKRRRKQASLRAQRRGQVGELFEKRSRQILADATAHLPRTRRLTNDRLGEISGRLASFALEERDPGKFSSDEDADAAALEAGRLILLDAKAVEEDEAREIRRRRSASRRRALAEERRRQDRIQQAREQSRASVLAAEQRRQQRSQSSGHVLFSPRCPPERTSSAQRGRLPPAASPGRKTSAEQQDVMDKQHAAFLKRVEDSERQRRARLAAKREEKEAEQKLLLTSRTAKRSQQDLAKAYERMHSHAKQIATKRENLREAHERECRAASAPRQRSPPSLSLRRSASNSAGASRPSGPVWSRLAEDHERRQAAKQDSEARQLRIARENSLLSTTAKSAAAPAYRRTNTRTPSNSRARAKDSPSAKRSPAPIVIVGPNPPPLMNGDIAHVIIQAARWVAVQGDEFEKTLKTKYATDPRFLFLFQKHSRGAQYYRARLLFEQQQQCFAPHALRPADDRRKIMAGQSPRPNAASNARSPKKTPPRKPTRTPRNDSGRRASSKAPSTQSNISIEEDVRAEKLRQQRQDERAAAARKKQKETKQAEAAKQAAIEAKRAEKARAAAKAKAERQRAAAARREAEASQKRDEKAARAAGGETPSEIRGGGDSTQHGPASADFLKTKKSAANNTLHVGGIEGELEDEVQLRELFSQFGGIDTVTLRRRREGKKVSWALITFESPEGVSQAVGAQSWLKNDGLVVRPVDIGMVKRSTGAMSQVMHQHRSLVDDAGVATMELFHVDESRLAAIERRHFAAVKMQALWRGKLAREKVLGMIDVDEGDEDPDGKTVERGRWSRVRFLDAVPLMKAMSHAELRRIADAMASEHYENEEIFEEGVDGDSMYIVKEGVAVAEKAGVEVARYRSGDYFGERALTEGGGKRSATVRADGAVECLRLSYGPFHELMGQCPHVAAVFSKQAETYSDDVQSANAVLQSQLAMQAAEEQARQREAAEFAAAEAEAAVVAQEAATKSAPAPDETPKESEGERAVRKAEGAVKRTEAEIAAVMETFKVGVPVSVIETGQTGVVQSASTEGLVRVLLDEPDGRPLPKILQADAIRVTTGDKSERSDSTGPEQKVSRKQKLAAAAARKKAEAEAKMNLKKSSFKKQTDAEAARKVSEEEDAQAKADVEAQAAQLFAVRESEEKEKRKAEKEKREAEAAAAERAAREQEEAARREAENAKLQMELDALTGADSSDDDADDADDSKHDAQAPPARDRNWSSDPELDKAMLTPPILGNLLRTETLTAVRFALGRQDAQERLVEEICSVMSCDRASIFLIDQKTEELVIHGSREDDARNIRIPRTMGIAGISAATGEHMVINDTYNDTRFNPAVDAKTGYTTKQLMATAIRDAAGAIVGVLQAINKHGSEGFGAEDSKLLEEFAVLAGSTLTYSVSLRSGDDTLQIVPDRRSLAAQDEDDLAAEQDEAHEEVVESFQVTCPEGVEPGQLLYVTTPLGREIQLIVPEGVGPGDLLQVGDPPEDPGDGEYHADEQKHSDEHASAAPTVVTVPDGVGAGDVVSIELPDGREIDVEVPEGLQAGDTFEVDLQPTEDRDSELLAFLERSDDSESPVRGSEDSTAARNVAKELKLVLIGSSGCGKTALLRRVLSSGGDSGVNYTPTVGMSHNKLTVTTMRRILNLVVWDRSGADTYGAVSSAYYKKAACGIVVYDATAPESFDAVGATI